MHNAKHRIDRVRIRRLNYMAQALRRIPSRAKIPALYLPLMTLEPNFSIRIRVSRLWCRQLHLKGKLRSHIRAHIIAVSSSENALKIGVVSLNLDGKPA